MPTVAIVGGVKGIEREYKDVAKVCNCKCKLFNQKCPQFDKKIKSVDACILFTNTVSHKLSKESCKICKKYGIKVVKMHSSGITGLKQTLEELELNG